MTIDPDDLIARIRAEKKEDARLDNTYQRARRRKSAWNLLLPAFFFPLWLVLILNSMHTAARLHAALHPAGAGDTGAFWDGGMDGPHLMILIPLLIATIVPAMMVANFLIYFIPPARRAMDNEGRGHAGTDYSSSQRVLFKFGLVIALVGAGPFVAGLWLT